MSWMKRTQTGGPPTSGSEQTPYSPSQNPYANPQNVYQNYTTTAPTNPNPQQYWQMQTPQQYDNANQLYQQNNQSSSLPQTGYHPSYSLFNQNQSTHQQNYMQNQQNVDGWQDNWDWGWDENAKQASNTQQSSTVMTNFMPQQQSYNNANVIEESFTSNDTWNWSMNEKKEDSHVATGISEETGKVIEQQECNNQAPNLDSNVHSDSVVDKTTVNQPAQTMLNAESQVKTLNDRDVVKEKMPNLALGKRIHLDNLTPQWSIESQMSQESSDGPATQFESTYRSDSQSRNSNKSSPGLNMDNFNYVPSNVDDMTLQDLVSAKNIKSDTIKNYDNFPSDRAEMQNNPDNLTMSLKEMNITNRENVTPDVVLSADNSTHDPLESISNTTSNVTLAASSVSMPPPNNFPPISASQNPFKHSGVFSHKNVVKSSSPNVAPINQPSVSTFSKDISDLTSNSNLSSPSVINKLSQQRNKSASYYQTANLETTPDNSERPDHPQLSNFRSMPIPQPIPDNLEVAPKNDRNEYLQTAHLSSGDYGENTDFTREALPLGLRRLVVGQQEGEYSQTLNLSSDEPPPGLSRMVPGQQNESDNIYSQPNDDYLGRHIDGQPTDATSRNSYRQADGQQIHTNFMSNTTSRNSERRPIGLDRMVPGEPSLDEYSRSQQYQNTNYSTSSEHRIVTGVDYDYPQMTQECNPSEIREQNVDGSDYMEHMPRGVPRNVVGVRDVSVEAPMDYNLHTTTTVPDLDQTRELTVEGENLQDLSIISSVELSFSRDQPLDGADMTIADLGIDRKTDMSDSIDLPMTSSRRQSLNRTNTSGEDSERDKTYKASPKRDRGKHKSTRDKDLRHSREERKYERDPDRRSGRDRDERDRRFDKERKDKDRDRRDYKDETESPESRRYRRVNRSHRYETEDTDYYSDRERERRRYREGSYTSSKPPRPDDKDRRYREDKDRNRRYTTIERERRYDQDSDRYGSSRRRSDRDRGREDVDRKYDDRKYRDIDPDRKYGNLKREKEERRRVGERELDEDQRDEGRIDERTRRRHRRDRHYDPYYDGYGAAYSDPYMLQRQQQQTFQYYEQLRLSNPAAYMEIYKKLMAGHPLPPAGSVTASAAGHDPSRNTSYLEGYGGIGYEVRGEERGSVHSGRSSANGLTGKDTRVRVCAHRPRTRYYGAYRGGAVDAGSVRDAYSLRTDLSDRDFTTDASLNLQLEESVRSERMTPLKFATAHVKGSLSSRHLVVVRASYGRALDGRPAAVHVLRLSAALADDPQARELDAYPGPLLTGVTHKKSVIEYCEAHVRSAEHRAGHDLFGYVLIWELLALLLRQNGTVVGSDIAELLMKNAREYEHRSHIEPPCESGSRGSAASSCASRPEPRPHGADDEPASAPAPFAVSFDPASVPPQIFTESTTEEPVGGDVAHTVDNSKEKIDKLREFLIYGNRQQALGKSIDHGYLQAAHVKTIV
ncbi:Protein transport protein Sec16A [Eumeta japonica]|uniref:Protein transport protein Sec16A n=1 Tax=Eumeta variegata TaxID=151549 RepID=A0A4C1YVM4_EUMVA|nr:Protein transport protein Sec16A [Eumeta japonica]